MQLSDLENLGLTKNESKIYIALLELRSAPAVELINKTGFHRNIIYDNLKRLIEKGLVSSIQKDKKTFFEVAYGDALVGMLETQQKEIEKKKEFAQKLIPEIERFKQLSKVKEEATIFKGFKGVTGVIDSALKEGGEFIAFGASTKEGITKFYKFFFPRWHKERIKKRVKMRILYSEEDRTRGEEVGKMKYTRVKFLAKEFTNPMSAAVYGNNTIIITWGEEPFAFLIRSKEVSTGIKAYFESLWSIAKE